MRAPFLRYYKRKSEIPFKKTKFISLFVFQFRFLLLQKRNKWPFLSEETVLMTFLEALCSNVFSIAREGKLKEFWGSPSPPLLNRKNCPFFLPLQKPFLICRLKSRKKE